VSCEADELNEEPIAPPTIPQESVVVLADKIFEMPGRLDRPSHVSRVADDDFYYDYCTCSIEMGMSKEWRIK